MSAEWQSTTYTHLDKDGSVSNHSVNFYMNPRLAEFERAVVILPGLGEGQAAIKRVVDELPQLGLVGVHIPFEAANTEDMEQVVTQAPLSVAEQVQKMIGHLATPDIVGYSIGGGIALKSFDAHVDKWRHAALVLPFGLNNQALDAGKFSKQKEVRLRLIRSRQVEGDDAPRPMMSREAAGILVRMLKYGVSQDGVPIIKRLYDSGRPVQVIAGAEDIVFPPEEIKSSLGRVGLAHLMSVVPGRHLSFADSEGRRQLYQGIARLPDYDRIVQTIDRLKSAQA
jgi:pimeloyl-ACP methyl ester carboxylesterase